MLGDYVQLTKPRMVAGNLLVAFAAFIFGSYGSIDWQACVLMLVGLGAIIASGCTLNNYYDRHIDARMERTKTRALAQGSVNPTAALTLGFLLLVAGVAILFYTNLLTLGVALVGWVSYVCLYTPLKHKSAHALWVGAVAGATPVVAGYTAATNTLDATALALFIFLCLWQVPHFLAIARYRFDEYAAAGVPLLVHKPGSEAERHRARKIFYASLVVLLVFCAVLILQRWIR